MRMPKEPPLWITLMETSLRLLLALVSLLR